MPHKGGDVGRWQLIGAVSGIRDHNAAAFEEAAAVLRAEGLEVINPVALIGHNDVTHEEAMEICLGLLLNKDTTGGIVLRLPEPDSWTKSRGAPLEAFTCLEIGKPLLLYHRDREQRTRVHDHYMHMGPFFVAYERNGSSPTTTTESTATGKTIAGG